MGDYWVPIKAILEGAGCQVEVLPVNAGWEERSRSSGGFNGAPLGVQWHHTASSASVEGDLNYMINGSPDEPVGNVLLGRDGVFRPVAAGAANTSGKGGPNNFSRGTVPLDSGNTHLFSIEIANSGVGEQYPQVQIDAAFKGSNALNAAFGNQPQDVIPHSLAEGTGYTSRKIDPATTNVEGPWVPHPVNSSQTWSHADLMGECAARAGGAVPPPVDPPPVEPPPVEPPVEPPANDWWTPLMHSLPTIRKGSSGIAVKRMQHLLAADGFMQESNTSNYDGQFGSGTEGALKKFQSAAGGVPDGVCGPWTWGALMHTIDGIPTIKKGASGKDVKKMQHLLAANGFMNEANMSNYDGAWGNGTENAKIKFDNAHGLTPSPPTDCGKGSWTALLSG